MAKIRIYTVHINPEAAQPYHEPVFILEGFNWHAFLFGPLWLLYQRLWWPLAALTAAGIGMKALELGLNLEPFSASVMQFGIQAILGFIGNDLLRQRYQNQGFITTDIVASDNKLRAEQRFLERILAQSKAPA